MNMGRGEGRGEEGIFEEACSDKGLLKIPKGPRYPSTNEFTPQIHGMEGMYLEGNSSNIYIIII